MKKYIFLIILIVLIVLAIIALLGFFKWKSDRKVQPQPAAQKQEKQYTEVKVAVLALDDNGKRGPKIGCNDSVIYLDKTVAPTPKPLDAAMTELFALPEGDIAASTAGTGYYNVMYKMKNRSNGLDFIRSKLENGVAKLYFKGELAGFDGVCDIPRVPAQIEGTAKQVEGVTEVQTFVNDQPVDWTTYGNLK